VRITIFLSALFVLPALALADPLPSWNSGDSKSAIIAFVESVTDADANTYVPSEDPVAVFDNDGTLWTEQPAYFQPFYALDVLSEKAATDPSILKSDILKVANDGNMRGMMAKGEEGLVEIHNVSHATITPEDFEASAQTWLTTAKHPTADRTYASMTYQPMLELLSYLRDEGFTTYIVSGGGIDFIRSIADEVYGIPPWQVVGTEGKTAYGVSSAGTPTITKEGGVTFIDDKEGNPIGIHQHIGIRPIAAFGNSDGDFEMLEWVTSGDGPRLGMLVHHDAAKREVAYDRDSHVGRLSRGLDEGPGRGWVITSMKNDWQCVFADQCK
jgi:phosphoglycolate phosphatase-like HAD superfamily hydrolase